LVKKNVQHKPVYLKRFRGRTEERGRGVDQIPCTIPKEKGKKRQTLLPRLPPRSRGEARLKKGGNVSKWRSLNPNPWRGIENLNKWGRKLNEGEERDLSKQVDDSRGRVSRRS